MLADRAGIAGASAHWLRRSMAIAIYRKTGDLEVVRAALGHASIQTTTRYAKADEASVRRAVGA